MSDNGRIEWLRGYYAGYNKARDVFDPDMMCLYFMLIDKAEDFSEDEAEWMRNFYKRHSLVISQSGKTRGKL